MLVSENNMLPNDVKTKARNKNRLVGAATQDNNPSHGPCMASLIGGTLAGSFPVLKEITFVPAPDPTEQKYWHLNKYHLAFETVYMAIKDMRAKRDDRPVVISLSASSIFMYGKEKLTAITPPGMTVEDAHKDIERRLQEYYKLIKALTSQLGRVLVVLAAGQNPGTRGWMDLVPQHFADPKVGTAQPGDLSEYTNNLNERIPELLLVGGLETADLIERRKNGKYGERARSARWGSKHMVFAPYDVKCMDSVEWNNLKYDWHSGTSVGEMSTRTRRPLLTLPSYSVNGRFGCLLLVYPTILKARCGCHDPTD
jgi:hypothetical protein